MKITDLRIGNWINIRNHDAKIGPAFFTDFDNYDFENDGIFKPEIQPILLTEEWLLKFGFKKGKVLTNIYYSLNIDASYGASIVAFIENEKKLEIYLSDCDGGHIGKKLEYVHELQNLYFALTGEELEVINN